MQENVYGLAFGSKVNIKGFPKNIHFSPSLASQTRLSGSWKYFFLSQIFLSLDNNVEYFLVCKDFSRFCGKRTMQNLLYLLLSLHVFYFRYLCIIVFIASKECNLSKLFSSIYVQFSILLLCSKLKSSLMWVSE